MRTGVLSLIFALVAVGCLSTSALAGRGSSLDQILPQIREQHPGTFSDADGPFMGPDGRPHYRIKWVTPEGRIQWFDADAQTGRVTNAAGRREEGFNDRNDGRGNGRGRRNHFGDDGLDNPFDDNRDRDWNRGRDRGDGDRGSRRDDRGDWRHEDRGNGHGNHGGGGNPFGQWGGGGNGNGDGNGRHRGHGN